MDASSVWFSLAFFFFCVFFLLFLPIRFHALPLRSQVIHRSSYFLATWLVLYIILIALAALQERNVLIVQFILTYLLLLLMISYFCSGGVALVLLPWWMLASSQMEAFSRFEALYKRFDEDFKRHWYWVLFGAGLPFLIVTLYGIYCIVSAD